MLNILLGIGVSSAYYNVANQKPYLMEFTPTLVSSASGLLFSLVSSLIIVPYSDWKGSVRYGVYLIVIYLMMMVVNVSLELSV